MPTPGNNNNAGNSWPQLGGSGTNQEWGYSLPPTAASTFYTSASQFSPTATDLTLSNFYYQMSQHNAQPLKMLAVNLPVRVNVTATTTINNSGNAWGTYGQMVMDRIRTNYQSQLQAALAQGLDARVNTPNYASDNSLSGPDNQIDYTVLIWRYTGGSPPGTNNLQNNVGGGGGYAEVPYATLTPVGATPAITTADGFTQCAGFEGLSKSIFTHEFAHTLYAAPHTFGANGVVGNHFTTSGGFGMIGGPMLDCANAWERWYVNWIQLQASGINADVSDAAALPAGGLLTLRDFITSGDAVRIRLPNSLAADGTYQYLWLENHQGKSIFDRRQWDKGGQSPPLPFPDPARGLVAYVEDMHVTRTTPRGPTGNEWLVVLGAGALRVLPANGNYDARYDGTTSTFNNRYWGNPIYGFDSRIDNATGPANHLASPRADRNGDGVINYDPDWNNMSGPGNEGFGFMSMNGQAIDGIIGEGMPYKTVGQKISMGDNPALFPSQEFNPAAGVVTPIKFSGLSVTLTNVAANGDITVKVSFDDVDLTKNVRWTGNVVLNPVPGSPYAAKIKAGARVTVDVSGTPNRTNAIAGATFPFSTPTRLTVKNGATLHIEDNGVLAVRNGSTVYVEDAATLSADYDGVIQVWRGSRVSVKTQAMADALRTSGQLRLLSGGQLEVRDTGAVITGRAANPPVLEVYPNPAATLAFRLADATPTAEYQYRVLNTYGQPLRTAKATGQALAAGVQLAGLPTGPYLLEVQAPDGTRTVQRAEIR